MERPPREEAITLALEGLSLPAIADRLGVHRSTVWDWMQAPDTAAKLARARTQRREAIGADLDAGAADAVALLRQVVQDLDAPIAVRVRAAADLLDRAGVTPAVALEIRRVDQTAAAPVRRQFDTSRLTDDELETLNALLDKMSDQP